MSGEKQEQTTHTHHTHQPLALHNNYLGYGRNYLSGYGLGGLYGQQRGLYGNGLYGQYGHGYGHNLYGGYGALNSQLQLANTLRRSQQLRALAGQTLHSHVQTEEKTTALPQHTTLNVSQTQQSTLNTVQECLRRSRQLQEQIKTRQEADALSRQANAQATLAAQQAQASLSAYGNYYGGAYGNPYGSYGNLYGGGYGGGYGGYGYPSYLGNQSYRYGLGLGAHTHQHVHVPQVTSVNTVHHVPQQHLEVKEATQNPLQNFDLQQITESVNETLRRSKIALDSLRRSQEAYQQRYANYQHHPYLSNLYRGYNVAPQVLHNDPVQVQEVHQLQVDPVQQPELEREVEAETPQE